LRAAELEGEGGENRLKRVLDFIVIGAQRCGTTSLFEYIRGHPELAVPPQKEMPYFSHGRPARSWEEYIDALFRSADPDARWGTITPQYMVGGLYRPAPDGDGDWGGTRIVPERIAERCPEARLVAILRDPVERARSHHQWASEAGWETRPFAEAIADLLTPEALANARARPGELTGYVTWGEYARILAGYFDVFPREQILVVYTSELKQNPARLLRRFFRFLGVPEHYQPPHLGTHHRATALVPRRSQGLKRRLDSAQAALARNTLTRGLLADRLLGRLAYHVDSLNRIHPRNEFPHVQVTPQDHAIPTDEIQLALRAHYEQNDRQLASLLGESPPWLGPAEVP
jgi:sulfotransferase family protein